MRPERRPLYTRTAGTQFQISVFQPVVAAPRFSRIRPPAVIRHFRYVAVGRTEIQRDTRSPKRFDSEMSVRPTWDRLMEARASTEKFRRPFQSPVRVYWGPAAKPAPGMTLPNPTDSPPLSPVMRRYGQAAFRSIPSSSRASAPFPASGWLPSQRAPPRSGWRAIPFARRRVPTLPGTGLLVVSMLSRLLSSLPRIRLTFLVESMPVASRYRFRIACCVLDRYRTRTAGLRSPVRYRETCRAARFAATTGLRPFTSRAALRNS